MEDTYITEDSLGKVLYESKPWCSAKKQFVKEDCWQGCNWYCRYQEVKTDELRISNGSRPTRGYANGKWKNMPNFRCNVSVKICDIPEYLKEDDNG